MSQGNKRIFHKGDAKNDVLNHRYLQSLEERIRRLEQLSVTSPLQVLNSAAGINISLGQIIQNYEIVKLTSQLDRNHANTSGFSDSETYVDVLKYNEADGVWEDSDIQFETIEICGVTSLDDTVGILLDFPRGGATTKRIFVPWPLAQGDNLPNYDFTKHQALTHAANGYLQWMDIGNCSGSESGLSG